MYTPKYKHLFKNNNLLVIVFMIVIPPNKSILPVLTCRTSCR